MPNPQDNSIPMVGQMNGTYSVKMVPPEQMNAARSAGWENAFKMVGPDGSMKWVPSSQVADARTNKFAVMEQPGTLKAIDDKKNVTFIMPSEAEDFQRGGQLVDDGHGNALPDKVAQLNASMLAGQVGGQDSPYWTPEQKAEAARGKAAGTIAAPLTALTVASGGALLAPSVTPVAGGMGFGGAAAGETLGPSALARLAASPAGKFLLKRALEAGAAGGGATAIYKFLHKAGAFK